MTSQPCPFCGNHTTSIIITPTTTRFAIECDACGARGPKCSTAVEAQSRWDRRDP